MHRLISKLILDQRVRFLMVGATNTVVGYLVFAALTHWIFDEVFLGYLISLALSYALAITLAFLLYRRFVFGVTGHVLRDFIRFVGVYLVAIGINAIALPLLVEGLRLSPLLAQAIILIMTTIVSFFGHREFSFRRDSGEVRPEDVAPG